LKGEYSVSLKIVLTYGHRTVHSSSLSLSRPVLILFCGRGNMVFGELTRLGLDASMFPAPCTAMEVSGLFFLRVDWKRSVRQPTLSKAVELSSVSLCAVLTRSISQFETSCQANLPLEHLK